MIQKIPPPFSRKIWPSGMHQDALITNLVVYPAIIDGNRAQVYVRFRNFDTDNAMIYSFVSESRAWKLDEIAAVGDETRWLLTDVLRNP